MRLEDAFLYLVVDDERVRQPDAVGFCRNAIAGGTDVIEIGGLGLSVVELEPILEVCREDEALCFVRDDAALAQELGADGVRLTQQHAPVSHVRVAVGDACLVGATTQSLDTARLAVETGVDFLIDTEGRGCVGTFAALGAAAGVVLFAGALDGLESGRALVELGVYRLCVEARLLVDGDTRERMAEFARLLGRCL